MVKALCLAELWHVSPSWRYFVEAFTAGGPPSTKGPAAGDRYMGYAGQYDPCDTQHLSYVQRGRSCTMREWYRVTPFRELRDYLDEVFLSRLGGGPGQ